MKYHGLMKKITLGILAGVLSANANATYLSIAAEGGFNHYTEDLAQGTASTEYVSQMPDGTLVRDADQSGGATVHDGLRWGGNGTYSSLVLENFAPDIDALDTAYAVSAITHNNFDISAQFAWLVTASIAGSLEFSSTHSGGIAAGFGSTTVVDDFTSDVSTEFNIDFKETYNTSSTDTCERVSDDVDPSSGDHVYVSACDDYFDFSVDNPDPLPDSLPFSIPFYIDGEHFALTVFFSEDGATPIDRDRLWTEEEKTSTFYTMVSLSRVPEPETLLLLGMGLLGLGCKRRNKTA
ncbi:THxN family PEP-CTERM protein [Thalassomonas sp. RHCl1]|uniref:THxN family PEP-CTERM protein n=1 Tax=Thalassomonas sp. RHCl1 TaxID=2995320 RepID=UPI00248B69E4|nr:THxN family PEP-CTERM protein [Thalassomonas sp. RHCl1]